ATRAPTVYLTSFTTSSTGGLSGTAGAQLTLTFPSDTDLSKLTNGGFVTDQSVTNHPTVGGFCGVSGLVVTCSIFNGSTVPGGHQLQVELDGVINPSTASSPTNPYMVSVSTTS